MKPQNSDPLVVDADQLITRLQARHTKALEAAARREAELVMEVANLEAALAGMVARFTQPAPEGD